MGPVSTIKLVFIGLFLVGCAAVWGYQALYVWPRVACEKHHGWFDPRSRTCGTVVWIPDITGRVPGRPDIRGLPRRSSAPQPG